MDEISLFTALRPDPAAGDGAAFAAVRTRIVAASGEPPAPRNRFRGKKLALGGGLAAAVAAAAIAVPVMLPTGGGGSLGAKAWAVDSNPDGTVTVAFSEVFDDPVGLQQALRAYGVRAEIRVVRMTPLSPGKPDGEYGMSCLYRTSGLDEPGNVQRAVVTNMHITLRDTRFTVRPSAMPPGSVMFIEIGKHSRQAVTWESAIGPEMLTRPATDCVPVK